MLGTQLDENGINFADIFQLKLWYAGGTKFHSNQSGIAQISSLCRSKHQPICRPFSLFFSDCPLIQKRLNLTYLKSNKESYLSKANKDSSCGNVNATKCAPFIVILGIINSPGEPYSWRGRRQILGMTSIRVFTYCSMVPCNCKVTEKMDSSQQARGREGTKRKENNNCEDPAH